LAIAGNRCRTWLAAVTPPVDHLARHPIADQSARRRAATRWAEEVWLALSNLRADYRQAFLLFMNNNSVIWRSRLRSAVRWARSRLGFNRAAAPNWPGSSPAGVLEESVMRCSDFGIAVERDRRSARFAGRRSRLPSSFGALRSVPRTMCRIRDVCDCLGQQPARGAPATTVEHAWARVLAEMSADLATRRLTIARAMPWHFTTRSTKSAARGPGGSGAGRVLDPGLFRGASHAAGALQAEFVADRPPLPRLRQNQSSR